MRGWWRLSASLLQQQRRTSVVSRLMSCNPHQPWPPHMRSVASLAKPERVGPLEMYKSMVARGALQQDARQENVAEALDQLLVKMKSHNRQMKEYHVELRDWEVKRKEMRRKLMHEEAATEARRRIENIEAQGRNRLARWFSRKARNISVEQGAGFMVARIEREKKLDSMVGRRPRAPEAPQGVYLYGNVGCGKTLLMDLFYKSAEDVVRYRRRMHFHAAMLEVHSRMHMLWRQGRHKPRSQLAQSNDAAAANEKLSNAPSLEDATREWLEAAERFESEHHGESAILNAVADELLGSSDDEEGGASVLCFDEVQVLDVFTAVALAGILGRLLTRGAVIVATSNRAPWDLNKDGLQKELFAVFVNEIAHHCRSMLVGTETDYRRVMATPLKGEQIHYFWPLGGQSQLQLERLWEQMTAPTGSSVGPSSIPVMFGRTLEIPESCNGVARFTFDEACSRPVGAADYIALAQHYHTVFITDIPILSMRFLDKARRFITLVDELYNHHCRLICTAGAPPDDLFLGTMDGTIFDLESLQFETEAEGGRLRRDVTAKGNVAPVGATRSERTSIQSIFSGREEAFAFRRAVSRLLEMQSPVYLQTLDCHPKYPR